MTQLVKPAIFFVICVALFLVDGTDAAIAFLHGDSSQAVLGSIATVLVIVLGAAAPYLPWGTPKR